MKYKRINYNELIGKVFGKRTVIEVVGRNKHRHVLVKCRCECGKENVVEAYYLLHGRLQSCHSCDNIRILPIYMIGKVFGKRTVIEDAGKDNSRNTIVRCRCGCGREDIVVTSGLLNGRNQACPSCAQTIHNLSRSPIYRIWAGMRSRCNNPKSNSFHHYGGRGIKVCERWNKFENFVADMGERPDGMQIDRIDPDGNYEPGNCRWVTPKENSANRRCSAKYKGQYQYVKTEAIDKLKQEIALLKKQLKPKKNTLDKAVPEKVQQLSWVG